MQPTDTYPADAYPAGSDPMSYPAYPDYPETPTYPAYADYPGSPTYMATSGYQGYPGVDYPTVHGWATAAQSAAAGIPEGLAPDYSASFITAIRRTIQRPLRFRGMASRREFWFSYLAAVMFSFATLLPTVLIVSWAEEAMDTPPISMQLLAVSVVVLHFLVFIVFILPAGVRRLHDGGRSGWWLLLCLIPYGGFAVLVLLALEPRPWLWRPRWTGGAVPAAPPMSLG